MTTPANVSPENKLFKTPNASPTPLQAAGALRDSGKKESEKTAAHQHYRRRDKRKDGLPRTLQ
jgi:hypothetical protein